MGLSQARILAWVFISSPRGSSQPKDWTHISCPGRGILYRWAIWESQGHEEKCAESRTHLNGWVGLVVSTFYCCSVAQPCLTLCNPMDCSTPGFLSLTTSQRLLKLMSIESVMPSNHLFLCRPLLLLPSIFPSIRVFASEATLRIRWPKYWSFNFSISPSNEYSGLISFSMDWFDPIVVQGTLKRPPQYCKVISLQLK